MVRNLLLPSGNNATLASGNNLGLANVLARDLLLPSGNSLTLGIDKNLTLSALTLLSRQSALRHSVRFLWTRELAQRGTVSAFGLRGQVMRQTLISAVLRDAVLRQPVEVFIAGRSIMLRQSVATRSQREMLLRASVDHRAVRVAVLRHGLHAFARSGYRLVFRNLGSAAPLMTPGGGALGAGDNPLLLPGAQDVEVAHVDAGGSLDVTGLSLPDGDYEVRVYSSGGYWRDALHLQTFRVQIDGGVVVVPLPTVSGLSFSRSAASLLISWSWQNAASTGTPEDFGVWYGSAPVAASGTPDAVVTARQPGGYSLALPATSDQVYVAAAARLDGRIGPASLLTVPADVAALTSPDRQGAFLPSTWPN